MFLSRKSNNNQHKIIIYLRSALLIGSVLTALLTFYKPPMGLVVSIFLGIFYFYAVLLLPTRRSQLLAILILALLSGVIPSTILWSICNFSRGTNSCQVNSLRAETLGFFVFPTIFMLIPWIGSFFYRSQKRDKF